MQRKTPGRKPRRSDLGPHRLWSVVAVNLLAALVLFLCFERHRRDRTGIEALQADRFAGHFAIAVFTVLDPAQRRIDLGNKLALAVAGAQLKRAVGFFAGAVRHIGDVTGAVLQALDSVTAVFKKIVLPGNQFAPKIFKLALVHKWFVFSRTVIVRQEIFRIHRVLTPRVFHGLFLQ